MIVDALSVPLVPDYIGRVEARFLREYSEGVREWSQCVEILSLWEDEHLLDAPTPELLERHKQTAQRLLRFGQFISRATAHPDFPDRELAQIVAATQSCLQDKLSLWHGTKISATEREQILKTCFNES